MEGRGLKEQGREGDERRKIAGRGRGRKEVGKGVNSQYSDF